MSPAILELESPPASAEDLVAEPFTREQRAAPSMRRVVAELQLLLAARRAARNLSPHTAS